VLDKDLKLRVEDARIGGDAVFKGEVSIEGNVSQSGALTAESLTVSNSVAGGIEITTNSGAVMPDLTAEPLLSVVTTTAACGGGLADGVAGQLKVIVCASYVDDYVLTPANLANGTTITFDSAGASALLIWAAGAWHVVAGGGMVA